MQRKRRKLGGGVLLFEQKFMGGKVEFRVVMALYPMSCDGSHWLGLLLDEQMIFLPPPGAVETLPVGNARYESSYWGV